MANNPYVNKVELANGTTLIDLSTDTAVASDVAQGKYFHLATGERVQGTASGGGGGGSVVITQDEDGYLVLDEEGGAAPVLVQKSITANGTYDPEDDDADGYSEVTVNVPVPPGYIIPSGNKEITANGTNIDVASYATVSVSVAGQAKNTQTAQSTTRRNNTALGSIISLTCSKTGTYDVYWTCSRTNTSQTWGSQLYINGVAYGTENTSWSNNVQNNQLTDVALSKDDTVAVYGRSRSGYYIYATQLTIVEE